MKYRHRIKFNDIIYEYSWTVPKIHKYIFSCISFLHLNDTFNEKANDLRWSVIMTAIQLTTMPFELILTQLRQEENYYYKLKICLQHISIILLLIYHSIILYIILLCDDREYEITYFIIIINLLATFEKGKKIMNRYPRSGDPHWFRFWKWIQEKMFTDVNAFGVEYSFTLLDQYDRNARYFNQLLHLAHISKNTKCFQHNFAYRTEKLFPLPNCWITKLIEVFLFCFPV